MSRRYSSSAALALSQIVAEGSAFLRNLILARLIGAEQMGLADRLVIYSAPVLLGDAGRGMFRLPGIERMDDRVQLRVTEVSAVGDDLRITAEPAER